MLKAQEFIQRAVHDSRQKVTGEFKQGDVVWLPDGSKVDTPLPVVPTQYRGVACLRLVFVYKGVVYKLMRKYFRVYCLETDAAGVIRGVNTHRWWTMSPSKLRRVDNQPRINYVVAKKGGGDDDSESDEIA